MKGLGFLALSVASAVMTGVFYTPGSPGPTITGTLLAIIFGLRSAAHTIVDKE